MRIGFIGLGRMGANMVRRLVRDGHEIMVYNRTPEKSTEIEAEGEGATATFSIEELVQKLEAPRAVWVMVPAGDATEAQIEELLEHLEPGDTIIDGGNTNFHDDVRRHATLKEKGIHYVDAGTSGGIWGLQVGYCLMVGGDAAAVTPLEPIFNDARARRRLPPRRWARRGPLREDGPQRHRVRPDAGVRRGLRDHARERLRPRPRRDLGAVDAGLGRPLVAARAAGPRVPVERPGPRAPEGLGGRLRARAAGPSRRRSTGTCPRRSSRCRCRPGSGPARTTPTAARSSPRSATSSAVTQ